DDRVVLDEHGAVADRRLQSTHLARPLPLLGPARRLRRLANPAIDQALRADLRIAEYRRCAHIDSAQGRDVFAVLDLDLLAQVRLESLRDLAQPALRCGRC